MLIRNGTLLDGTRVDIRLGIDIEQMGADLPARSGEHTLDARGATVLPGLHDHHVHLRAAAAAADSVHVGPGQASTRARLGEILAAAAPGADGWVRAVGYHDSVAGPLDRHTLDGLEPDRPVRVQHRSGAMWILNSAALRRINQSAHPDGRFLRTDTELVLPEREPSLRGLAALLSRYGVTGVTDATPGHSGDDIAGIAGAVAAAGMPQRVHCMVPAGVPAVPGVTLGPAKRILDDTTLHLDALQTWLAESHAADHPVAVHCVTTAQLVVTLAALRGAGVHPGDRIEHAAVVPGDCIADLAELDVAVVTQPNFVAERGDEYLADVPPNEHDELWRVATLLDAGVRVALSTDAPFGNPDPWAAMRAAVRRTTRDGTLLGAAERISARTAVRMFLGHADNPARPRRIAVGQPGDLCVLSLPPEEALAELSAEMVAATVIGGELIYQAD